jgi:RNA polymerase sigma factor (sigma-70 family)
VSDTQQQFEQVFNRCYRAVYSYAARRVEPAAVQDVVSETFLIAWRRRAELEEPALPWLLGVARRVAANHRRSDARRGALHERLLLEQPLVHDSGPSARDPRLLGALAGLNERDREALMLVAWDGLDHRSAAKVMGCSSGAFSVRVHRARGRLARALSDAKPETVEIPEQARLL